MSCHSVELHLTSSLWCFQVLWRSPNIQLRYNGILVGGLEQPFFIFPYTENVIIPTDEVIFFRGVGIPPTSYNARLSYAFLFLVVFPCFPHMCISSWRHVAGPLPGEKWWTQPQLHEHDIRVWKKRGYPNSWMVYKCFYIMENPTNTIMI